MKPSLDEMLVVGTKLKLFYNKNNHNNKIMEIRAIVDEEYIVYRVWLKHKRYYDCFLEHITYFQVMYDNLSLYKR